MYYSSSLRVDMAIVVVKVEVSGVVKAVTVVFFLSS